MQKPVPHDNDIDWSGILQEDGIGSRGELYRGDIQELGKDIAAGSQDLPPGDFTRESPEIDCKYQARKDAARGQDGERRPIHQSDEDAAGAPQDGGNDQENDGCAAVDCDVHEEFLNQGMVMIEWIDCKSKVENC